MYRTKKRKRNKEFVCELHDIPEGEVEDTTEGDNVDVEEPELCVPYETYSDPENIIKASEPENPGGDKEENTTQYSTTTTTTTTQK